MNNLTFFLDISFLPLSFDNFWRMKKASPRKQNEKTNDYNNVPSFFPTVTNERPLTSSSSTSISRIQSNKIFKKKSLDPISRDAPYPPAPSRLSRPSTTSRLVHKKIEQNKLIPLKPESELSIPENKTEIEDASFIVEDISESGFGSPGSQSPELENPPLLKSTKFLINLLLKQPEKEEKDSKLKKRWNSRFHLDAFFPQYEVSHDRYAKSYVDSPLFIPIDEGKNGKGNANTREKEIESLVQHSNQLLNWIQQGNSGNKKKNLGIMKQIITKHYHLQLNDTEKFLTLLSNALRISSDQKKSKTVKKMGMEKPTKHHHHHLHEQDQLSVNE